MWNNSPHFQPQPSPGPQQQQQQQQQSNSPPAGPYSHRQSMITVSDQMSVSSGTTAGHAPPHQAHHSYIPIPTNPSSYHNIHHQYHPQQQQQQQQQQAPHNSNGYTITHFYPSSHIHNSPPNPLGLNPYISSPPLLQHPAPPPPPPPPPPSLTSILLNSAPHSFTTATQHPFLRHAGQGTLPRHVLSRWLSQDRLYAQSYIGFIGALIARVDLPYVHIPEPDKSNNSLRWRIVKCLTGALSNIHTELRFFEETARKYGLALDAPSRADGAFTAEPATKQYIDLFRAFWTDPSMSLLEGMVVLWATEIVYLSAWTYASSFLNAPVPTASGGQHQHQHGPASSMSLSASISISGTTSDARKSRAFSAKSDSGLSQTDTQGHPLPQSQRQSQSFSQPFQSQPSPPPSRPLAEANSSSTSSPPHTTSTGTSTSTPTPPASDTSPPHHHQQHRNDLDGGALRDAFIPNWTSRDFERFVADIAELTDLLAEREDAVARRLDVYKAVWRHVLDVEKRFWPDVSDVVEPGA